MLMFTGNGANRVCPAATLVCSQFPPLCVVVPTVKGTDDGLPGAGDTLICDVGAVPPTWKVSDNELGLDCTVPFDVLVGTVYVTGMLVVAEEVWTETLLVYVVPGVSPEGLTETVTPDVVEVFKLPDGEILSHGALLGVLAK